MKQALKVTTIAIVTGIVTFFSACNSNSADRKADNKNEQQDSTAAKHDSHHVFACSMHPEVTGKDGDICTKCGMKLEHTDIKDTKQ